MAVATPAWANPDLLIDPPIVHNERGVGQAIQIAQTSFCQGGEGSCISVTQPKPSDEGTPPEDGGNPPQTSGPSLTTPDLVVTKPHVAPDLEGRFSNGGNEEIW